MGSTIVAVVGTLLAGVLGAVVQQRADRTARSEQRADAQRRDLVTHVTSLAAALAAHRMAMWVREDLRLTGAPDAEYATARAESHATRAAITAPLAAVAILAPALRAAAHEAADATYQLRNAPDQAALTARRQAAITAVNQLLEHSTRLI